MSSGLLTRAAEARAEKCSSSQTQAGADSFVGLKALPGGLYAGPLAPHWFPSLLNPFGNSQANNEKEEGRNISATCRSEVQRQMSQTLPGDHGPTHGSNLNSGWVFDARGNANHPSNTPYFLRQDTNSCVQRDLGCLTPLALSSRVQQLHERLCKESSLKMGSSSWATSDQCQDSASEVAPSQSESNIPFIDFLGVGVAWAIFSGLFFPRWFLVSSQKFFLGQDHHGLGQA